MLAGHAAVFAQQPGSSTEDSTQEVHILNYTKRLTFQKIDDSTQLTIITGNVKLRQGKSLLYCDSCVMNDRTNVFEAWGHVHINDSDTTHIYASHLRYLIKTKIAYLDGGVRLTDGHGTLTTPDLEYDMQTNIGIYTHGGKVINKKTTLTSQEGWYYADMKDIYFKKNVLLKDPAYTIVTDSLLYNTETETTRFISMTTITDSNGRVIKTKEGFYNQRTGKAEFGQRATIVDPKEQLEITSDRFSSDDSSGISVATGNAIVVDKKNKTTIIAGIIYRNKNTDAIMAVNKPLMIIQQDNDSIYITADTLFSAKLTDLYRMQAARAAAAATTDSSNKKGIKDTSAINGKDSSIINTVRDTTGKISDTLSRNIPDTLTGINRDSLNIPVAKDTTGIASDTSISKNSRDSLPEIKKDSLSIPVADTAVKKPLNDKGANKTTPKIPVTKKPVLKNNKNPLTANVTKDSTGVDTVKGKELANLNEKDSTNRYFEAYRHVRIFNDSLQATSDSLFYSFRDSVFRLYQDPVVWAKGSQITGDTILLFTKNKKAEKIKAFENSFLVNKLDTQAFNQVKANRMDGYFVNGDIDSVRAKGYAECIYYIQDDDSAYTGINQSQSDIMDIYFRNKELFRVVMRTEVTGTLWPIRQKSPSEMRLEKFRWLEERRPKTKYEMYE
jgi:lipopolysaccharide export system protein LptA